MDVPPLDVFKVWLDGALGNLSQWKLSLLVAGLDDFPVLRRLWLSHTLGRQNFVHKAMLPFPWLLMQVGTVGEGQCTSGVTQGCVSPAAGCITIAGFPY